MVEVEVLFMEKAKTKPLKEKPPRWGGGEVHPTVLQT